MYQLHTTFIPDWNHTIFLCENNFYQFTSVTDIKRSTSYKYDGLKILHSKI